MLEIGKLYKSKGACDFYDKNEIHEALSFRIKETEALLYLGDKDDYCEFLHRDRIVVTYVSLFTPIDFVENDFIEIEVEKYE